MRGHTVWLACPPSSRLATESAARAIPLLPLDVRGYAHPFLAARLARFLQQRRIQIIHAEHSRDLATVVASIRLSGTRYPLLLTKHVGSYIMKRDPFHRFTYAHLDRVIAISNVLRDNVIATTPMAPDRVIVVHNGVDTNLFSPSRIDRGRVRDQVGIPLDAPLIGFVGRFSPGKGHEELLHALALLRGSHPSIRCLVVGEASAGERAYEQGIRSLCRTLGLDDIVTFAGFRTDIPEVMASFDIFAFPSHAEAFGLVLIEAMAMERAVVSTNCDGVLDIVVEGVTGLFVAPGDSNALAGALARLLLNPELRDRMGKAGRERVLESFDASMQIERLEDVYAEVLQEGKLK
jgi:glycosyltransferase involved in cell wall biosynthesis